MYVVAGVSGNTGSIVANALLEEGKKVRVLVRDASKGEPWKARGAEVAVGSVDDEEALTKAFEGATGAYLLSPPDLGATDLIAAKRKTVDTIARAVERSGIPHVVFLSSTGAQHESGTGIIRTVQYAEERLAKTPAKTTFIRAAYFLENWAGVLGAAAHGKLPTFLPPELVVPMVATKDIGLVAAKALLAPPAEKVDIIELSGPRDYTSIDIAQALSKIFGKPVEVDAAPLDAVVPTFTSFGFSPNVAGLFQEMYDGIAKGVVAFEGKRARAVRGTVDAEAALRPLTTSGGAVA
jgi:uncharacterized protein YbjT (DUF2867 family)